MPRFIVSFTLILISVPFTEQENLMLDLLYERVVRTPRILLCTELNIKL